MENRGITKIPARGIPRAGVLQDASGFVRYQHDGSPRLPLDLLFQPGDLFHQAGSDPPGEFNGRALRSYGLFHALHLIGSMDGAAYQYVKPEA